MIHRETFDTRIKGIPCQVEVAVYPGCKGARGDYGLPIEPDTEEEIEILAVLDRNGRKADWLAKKLDKDEEGRIVADIFDTLHRRRHE